jgi:hypothetical protein
VARLRTVHHEVALDDRLAECSWPARLAVVLLPTIADRDGRMRDNPKKIKAQIFPFDDGLDVDAVLDELAKVERLERYNVNGTRYLQLANWDDQQRPHIREAKSTIPGLCTVSAEHQPKEVPSTNAIQAGPVGLGDLGLGDLGQREGDRGGPAALERAPGALPPSSSTPETEELIRTFIKGWASAFGDVMGAPWSQNQDRFHHDLGRLFEQRRDVDRLLAVATVFLRIVKTGEKFPFDSAKLGSFLAHLDDIEARVTASGKVPRVSADGRPERTWRDDCSHQPKCQTPNGCTLKAQMATARAEREQEIAAAGGEEAWKARRLESVRSAIDANRNGQRPRAVPA